MGEKNGWTMLIGPAVAIMIPVTAGLVGLSLSVNQKMERADVVQLIDMKQETLVYKLDEQKKQLDNTQKKIEEVDKTLHENREIMKQTQEGINELLKKAR